MFWYRCLLEVDHPFMDHAGYRVTGICSRLFHMWAFGTKRHQSLNNRSLRSAKVRHKNEANVKRPRRIFIWEIATLIEQVSSVVFVLCVRINFATRCCEHDGKEVFENRCWKL